MLRRKSQCAKGLWDRTWFSLGAKERPGGRGIQVEKQLLRRPSAKSNLGFSRKQRHPVCPELSEQECERHRGSLEGRAGPEASNIQPQCCGKPLSFKPRCDITWFMVLEVFFIHKGKRLQALNFVLTVWELNQESMQLSKLSDQGSLGEWPRLHFF